MNTYRLSLGPVSFNLTLETLAKTLPKLNGITEETVKEIIGLSAGQCYTFSDKTTITCVTDNTAVRNSDKCGLAAELICDGLHWRLTDEGGDYWADVHYKLTKYSKL